MSIEAPIKHRNGDIVHCSHCNHEQKETIGLSFVEYFHYKKRLDDGLVDLEEKYFNDKYMVCTNCGNICEMFSYDNTKYFDTIEIESILLSNKPQTEKNFLVMNIIKNDFESLLDLYHYYLFVNDEANIKYWRNQLYDYCEKMYYETNSLYPLRIMIELHRRNKEFDKALNLIKTEYKKAKKLDKNNDINSDNIFEHNKIKKEKRLCKLKNSDAANWEISEKCKI